MRFNHQITTVFLLLVCILRGSLFAQDVTVPIEIQLPIFLKILTFDRNFRARNGDRLILGILYQKQFRTSVNVKESLVRELARLPEITEDGFRVSYKVIDLGNESNLAETLDTNRINTLYVTPLAAADIGAIAAVSRTKKLTTLTGVPKYAELGLAVAIGFKKEKPCIIINVAAAKAEGANFSAQLLELAKVIQ